MTNAAKPYTTAEGVTSKIDAVPAPPAFEFHRLRAAQAGISGYGCFAAHQMEMQHSMNHLCPHSPKMKFPREDKMYVTITPGTRVRCRSPFDYMHSISGCWLHYQKGSQSRPQGTVMWPYLPSKVAGSSEVEFSNDDPVQWCLF